MPRAVKREGTSLHPRGPLGLAPMGGIEPPSEFATDSRYEENNDVGARRAYVILGPMT